MYALRDVSGSTESLPLIASSIMSKKIAENPAGGLVLDVKTGSGAFLQDFDASVALAEAMVAAGTGAGIPTVALLTSADQPLGRTVGNWIETEEAVRLCAGHVCEAPDVAELAVHEAAQMLVMAGGHDVDAALGAARARLEEGGALPFFAAMVEAQGGDPSLVMATAECRAAPTAGEEGLALRIDHPAVPSSAHAKSLLAPRDGVVAAIDAKEIGLASVGLGAGRRTMDDAIDPGAGFRLHCKVGDNVEKGQALCTAFANDASCLDVALGKAGGAYTISDELTTPSPPLISHVFTQDSGLLPYAWR